MVHRRILVSVSAAGWMKNCQIVGWAEVVSGQFVLGQFVARTIRPRTIHPRTIRRLDNSFPDNSSPIVNWSHDSIIRLKMSNATKIEHHHLNIQIMFKFIIIFKHSRNLVLLLLLNYWWNRKWYSFCHYNLKKSSNWWGTYFRTILCKFYSFS